MPKPRLLTMTGRERLWLLQTTITGMLGAFITKKLMRVLYRAIRRQPPDSVFDPNSSRFSWPDVFLWAMAAGVGLGLAKVVSTRVATIGWKITTGDAPPGIGEDGSRS